MTRDYAQNPYPSTKEEFLNMLRGAEDEGLGEVRAAIEFVATWIETDAAKHIMDGMDDDIIWMVADYWRKEMT